MSVLRYLVCALGMLGLASGCVTATGSVVSRDVKPLILAEGEPGEAVLDGAANREAGPSASKTEAEGSELLEALQADEVADDVAEPESSSTGDPLWGSLYEDDASTGNGAAYVLSVREAAAIIAAGLEVKPGEPPPRTLTPGGALVPTEWLEGDIAGGGAAAYAEAYPPGSPLCYFSWEYDADSAGWFPVHLSLGALAPGVAERGERKVERYPEGIYTLTISDPESGRRKGPRWVAYPITLELRADVHTKLLITTDPKAEFGIITLVLFENGEEVDRRLIAGQTRSRRSRR